MTKTRKPSEKKPKRECPPVVVRVIPELLQFAMIYLSRKQQELPGILQAAKEADFGKLKRIGHDLKGSGGAYDLPQISEIGSRLESAAIAGDLEALCAVTGELERFLGSARLE